MDSDYLEKQPKFISEILENYLRFFFQKSPIKKLEEIKNGISYHQNSTYQILHELIENLNVFDPPSDKSDRLQVFDEIICREIDYFLQTNFQDFIYFIVLQTLFVSKSTPLNKEYIENLLRKHNMTLKKLQLSLLDTFGERVFRERVKKGGSKGFWDNNKKLQLLAFYNRFLIVIKNSRRDLRLLVKSGKLELTAKKEVLDKYNIPQLLINSAFSSYDAPKEVALNWAMQEMKVEFKEEYLKDILTSARKIWQVESSGLLSPKTIEQFPKAKLLLIDISFQLGCRYYAVLSTNQSKKDKLKYTSPAKEITAKPNSEVLENEFFVSWSF